VAHGAANGEVLCADLPQAVEQRRLAEAVGEMFHNNLLT
jgi:hypothetical protein